MGDQKEVRRTTIILDDKDRQYLESLIKEGKETGFKTFVTKMFDVYRSLGMDDWKSPGVYYRGISRIAIITQEVFDLLVNMIPDNKVIEAGKQIGETMSTIFRTDMDLNTKRKENLTEVFKQLGILGLGEFVFKDNLIVVRGPYINNVKMFVAFLEGLAGVKLQPRTTSPPLVIEVQK